MLACMPNSSWLEDEDDDDEEDMASAFLWCIAGTFFLCASLLVARCRLGRSRRRLERLEHEWADRMETQP